jgi:REP element-mobilizing transposase RayT
MRLPKYDCRAPGAYFVTLVTQDRLNLFGEVIDHEMRSNAAGRMVRDVWDSLPGRFPGTESSSCIVMPNHVHGILIIHENVGATFMAARKRAGMNPAPTVRQNGGPTLGRIIGAFNSPTTREYTRGTRSGTWPASETRLWQRNYYEHILRNDEDWQRMHLYIESNPANWDADDGNPGNVGRFPPCSP